MGQNKALIRYKGLPLIQHVYKALLPVSEKIIISSNSALPGFHKSLIVPDLLPDIGPIGGIYSCLGESKTELNLITTCDTPLLGSGFFRFLIEKSGDFDVTNPAHDGVNEPIIGVFHKSILPVIESYIDKKSFSPAKIIQSLNSQLVHIIPEMPFYNPKMFMSINTPEDLQQLEADF